jgi:hypothetical protein
MPARQVPGLTGREGISHMPGLRSRLMQRWRAALRRGWGNVPSGKGGGL